MRHARFLDFDALEGRKLLTRAHHVAAHHPHAAAAVALVLDGTLAANQKAAVTSMNADGSTMVSVPVAGVLAGLGQVRGFWNQSTDSFGEYLGPDTLQIRDARGAFVVVFNNANPVRPQRTAAGLVFRPLPQRVHGGAGAYAHATETGTIQVTSNPARAAASLTLNTPAG
jgi:hypothetical protein